jgi:hypothetical protein
MPLKWTIDRADRMVTVIAEGEVTLEQAEEYLDAVVVADAMPYAKLVDCTNMVTHASDDDMMQLAARIRAYATVMKGGPLCFVVGTPQMLDYTRRYLNLSTDNRPAQICKTVAEARAWLAMQNKG